MRSGHAQQLFQSRRSTVRTGGLFAASYQQFELARTAFARILVNRHDQLAPNFRNGVAREYHYTAGATSSTQERNMVVLTRQQVRELDRRAIQEYGISSLVLMENAGRNAANLLFRLMSAEFRP